MSDSAVLSPRKVKRSLARRIGLIAMVGLIVVGSVASLDAEARRMGGGRSFGRQSNTVQQQAAPSQPSPSNPGMQRAQPRPRLRRLQRRNLTARAGSDRSRVWQPVSVSQRCCRTLV